MKLTLQLQLLPDPEASHKLRRILERFNAAADWVAEQLYVRKVGNKILAQKLLYRKVRGRYALSSQTAILCIHRAVEAYKGDPGKQPRFRKHAAMTYDQRTMTFPPTNDRVSLLSLEGRVTVPFIMGEHQARLFSLRKGQADLVFRQDGKWFLLVSVDLPEGTLPRRDDLLGVDFGIVELASDSYGNHYSGEAVERVRRRHSRNRQRLQQKGTKGAKKRLRKLAGREARFRRHTNHVISKSLVALAKDTQRGIVLEDLRGIRSRTEKRLRRRQRGRHAGWSFLQLRAFVEYKAKLAGVSILVVAPAFTSRSCSQCGYCDKANRRSQAEFRCLHCGYNANADANAARNIRALGFRKQASELARGNP